MSKKENKKLIRYIDFQETCEDPASEYPVYLIKNMTLDNRAEIIDLFENYSYGYDTDTLISSTEDFYWDMGYRVKELELEKENKGDK